MTAWQSVLDALAGAHWLVPALAGVPLVGAALLLSLRRAGDVLGAWLGAVVSLVTLLLGVAATVAVVDAGTERVHLAVDVPWVPALGMRLHLGVDGVSAPLVLLTSALGLLVCAHLVRVRPEAGHARRLAACVLAVVGGANATFTALDLLLFFVAFEIVLIPMWFVIALWGDDRQGEATRTDASYRFVLYTAAGSAVMLLGILLVAARAGTTDLLELAAARGAGMSQQTQLLAAGLIVLGLAVKAPMFPLHTWLPPAHTIAPTAGSVLLAGVLLKLGTYGLVRVVVPVVPDGLRVLAPWLGAFGAAGVLWAGLACLVERDLKRLVAYSSVAHMGFVLIGIASMTPTGLQGALFANVAHGVVTALLFFVVGALKDREHGADLSDLGPGLRDRLPRLGWLLSLGAVAGLGLPGLAVFWGELLAIAGAWESDALSGLGRPIAIAAALGTAVAAAYWLRVLREVWHGPPRDVSASASAGDAAPTSDGDGAPAPAGDVQVALVGDATWHETLVWAPLVVATIALGLVPGPLLAATESAVQGLLTVGGVAP